MPISDATISTYRNATFCLIKTTQFTPYNDNRVNS